MSAKQFGPALTQTVAAALASSGLRAQRLTLEITESLLLDDERAVAQLREFRALGVRLSIDDFGTGYSSMSRLRSIFPSELKIDKSFIDEIVDSSSPAPMITAVIALGHAVGATVVAKGVETAAQRDFLIDQLCDDAQGYLFSRPVPPADLAALLAAQPRVARPDGPRG